MANRGKIARALKTDCPIEDDDEYEDDWGANTTLLAPGFWLPAPAFTASAIPPEDRSRGNTTLLPQSAKRAQ
jgi:hypothetical protein